MAEHEKKCGCSCHRMDVHSCDMEKVTTIFGTVLSQDVM